MDVCVGAMGAMPWVMLGGGEGASGGLGGSMGGEEGEVSKGGVVGGEGGEGGQGGSMGGEGGEGNNSKPARIEIRVGR